MPFLKKWFLEIMHGFEGLNDPNQDPRQLLLALLIIALWLLSTMAIIYSTLHTQASYAAGATLPGEDASGRLEAAGILLKTLDTGIFKWGARLFAGICIMSSAWALKEQRFGIAIICVVGAIIFGTAPKWVSNIFEVGGNAGVFSKNNPGSKVRSFRGAESAGDIPYV